MNDTLPPELKNAAARVGINPNQVVPAGVRVSKGVFIGFGDTKTYRPPTPTEIAIGKGKAPIAENLLKNQPQFEDAEAYKYRWWIDPSLRGKYTFNQWSNIVDVSAELTKYDIYQTPDDVAAVLSTGGGAGTAPVLTQPDAVASTQDVYRQALGREANSAELSAGTRKMRSVVAGGSSMNAAGEAVFQDIQETDEYQAELGDDVLNALVNRFASASARTR